MGDTTKDRGDRHDRQLGAPDIDLRAPDRPVPPAPSSSAVRRNDAGRDVAEVVVSTAHHLSLVDPSRQDEAFLRAIIECAAEPLIVTDAEGTISLVNRAAEHLCDRSRDALVGGPISALLPDVEAPAAFAHGHVEAGRGRRDGDRRGRVDASGTRWRETTLQPRDGSALVVELAVSEVVQDGRSWFTLMVRDVSRQARQHRRLVRVAFTDDLTGLANRVQLHRRLARLAGQEPPPHLALLFIDLDGFKQVNDDLGHEIGDQVLIAVAQRLRRAARDIDLLARYGGDEFIVLIEDEKDAAGTGRLVTERIHAALVEPIAVGPHELPVAASIGMATFPDETRTPTECITAADAAMYRSKRARRADADS